jgi:hypothetical protein
MTGGPLSKHESVPSIPILLNKRRMRPSVLYTLDTYMYRVFVNVHVLSDRSELNAGTTLILLEIFVSYGPSSFQWDKLSGIAPLHCPAPACVAIQPGGLPLVSGANVPEDDVGDASRALLYSGQRN